jgi:hypothetical protein
MLDRAKWNGFKRLNPPLKIKGLYRAKKVALAAPIGRRSMSKTSSSSSASRSLTGVSNMNTHGDEFALAGNPKKGQSEPELTLI